MKTKYERRTLTEEKFWELIHKKFGEDTSQGKTCDCEHCLVMERIENYEKNLKKQQTDDAFLSGLLQGWEESLKDPTEVKRVMEDMIEMAKKLVKKSGV